MPPRGPHFSVSPSWTHYASWLCIGCAFVVGLLRYGIYDRDDPLRCNALLRRGRWIDDDFRNWQPDGCMMNRYQPQDISECLSSRRIVFIGDSVTRELFFQFIHLVDKKMPTAPPDASSRHADYTFTSFNKINLSFYWDPYLNSTRFPSLLTQGERASTPTERPAMLVVGSGLWYLRYANESGGLPAWEARIESTLDIISRAKRPTADAVVLLPIQDVITAKLANEQAVTLVPSDIDAMNSDLLHRIYSTDVVEHHSILPFLSSRTNSLPVALPLVFNKMLEPSQTQDGLHFADSIIATQATVLLNYRCNDVLPKSFPLDKTCCNRYPQPSVLHLLVLVTVILWGPANWLLARRFSTRYSGLPIVRDDELPSLILSGAVGVAYLADRTAFWLKEQNQFDAWVFTLLMLASLAVGLLTVERTDNDVSFLNSEQIEEWMGWMQLAILLFNYTGASVIPGIQNSVRILIASYLFITGYVHTMFYVKKADYGLHRVAKVLIRLNLLALLLAYTMNTNYLFYFFAPLASQWYLFVYATMAAGSKYNDRMTFLVGKIVISVALVAWAMSEGWLLEALFGFLEYVCGIHWSPREWTSRVTLDLYITPIGMLAALAVLKGREQHLTEHPLWPLATKAAAGISGTVVLWYIAFELSQPDKFAYNQWHPYISFLPIGAYIILRNIHPVLRSTSSRLFALIGRCSLEMFVLQSHLWLAGDNKGILIIVLGDQSRPLNFLLTAVVFVYVSHQVAQATRTITDWICGPKKPSSLPTAALPSAPNPSDLPPEDDIPAGSQEIIFMAPMDEESPVKDRSSNDAPIPREPDTPIRPQRRWLDRLAAESPTQPASGFRVWYGENEWNPGLKARLLMSLALMWLVNLMWPRP